MPGTELFDQMELDAVSDVVCELLGPDKLKNLPTPSMGSEDFAYYLEKVPGAFFFIGVGDEAKNTIWPHHHCRFTIDEAQLCKGSAFEALCAWEFLNKA